MHQVEQELLDLGFELDGWAQFESLQVGRRTPESAGLELRGGRYYSTAETQSQQWGGDLDGQGGHFNYQVSISSSWQTVEIPWTSFNTPTWGDTDPSFPGAYKLVATVEVPDAYADPEACEHAFYVTQSLEGPWPKLRADGGVVAHRDHRGVPGPEALHHLAQECECDQRH